MKRILFAVGILAIIAAIVVIYITLHHEKALITNPKGIIAKGELHVIKRNLLLMITVTFPTLIILYLIAWRYRHKNSKAEYDPERSHGVFGELILWIIPSIIIAVMTFKTWHDSHELDPYRPIGEGKHLRIEVMALNWKWLFIYPDHGIATVNFVQFPANMPIHFELAADGSPMNSFWIPQLSGQIYAMTGMITPLHIKANEIGVYAGKAAEINGMGYAGMRFEAKASSQSDFDAWVSEIRKSPLKLTLQAYDELLEPSAYHPIVHYSYVEKDLFHKMVMKYIHPKKEKIWQTSSTENSH